MELPAEAELVKASTQGLQKLLDSVAAELKKRGDGGPTFTFVRWRGERAGRGRHRPQATGAGTGTRAEGSKPLASGAAAVACSSPSSPSCRWWRRRSAARSVDPARAPRRWWTMSRGGTAARASPGSPPVPTNEIQRRTDADDDHAQIKKKEGKVLNKVRRLSHCSSERERTDANANATGQQVPGREARGDVRVQDGGQEDEGVLHRHRLPRRGARGGQALQVR